MESTIGNANKMHKLVYDVLFIYISSIKIWNVSSSECLLSLGGHLHRVCWASVFNTDKMVTSSLDGSLKIWNLESILSPDFRPPPVGGIHYVVLVAGGYGDENGSSAARYFASNRGWGVACQLSRATMASGQGPTWEVVGTASSHGGFIEVAVFTMDGTRLVSVDLGHCGQYSVRDS